MSDPSKPFSCLDDTVVRLPAYEPADVGTLELSGNDLTKGSMLIGSTGAGKTNILRRMLRDIIFYGLDDPSRKIGLLILDFKMDETLSDVRAYCKECGREGDLVVIDSESEEYFDPMMDFTGPGDVDRLVDLIVSTLPKETGFNSTYFEAASRKRLTHFLTAYGLVTENPRFIEALRMAAEWLGTPADSTHPLVREFNTVCDDLPEDLDPIVAAQIHAAGEGFTEWDKHDWRTRSNEASTITNHLNNFLRNEALSCLQGRPEAAVDLRAIVDEGKIVVVRSPSSLWPEEASIVGRIIKGGFYDAIMNRPTSRSYDGRLVGMICDEAPLILTEGDGRYSDITQFAVLRARRAFFIGGTQGLAILDRRIGARSREALLANINNWFFLRNQESEVGRLASERFGTRLACATDVMDVAVGHDGDTTLRKLLKGAPVIHHNGSLERLAGLRTHQCFVQLSSRLDLKDPVWIEPLFSTSDEGSAPVKAKKPQTTFRSLRKPPEDEEEEEDPFPMGCLGYERSITSSLQRFAAITGKDPDMDLWAELLGTGLGGGLEPDAIRMFFEERELTVPNDLGEFPDAGLSEAFFLGALESMHALFDLTQNPLTQFGFFRGILLCDRLLADPMDDLFDLFAVHLQRIAVERALLDRNSLIGFEL